MHCFIPSEILLFDTSISRTITSTFSEVETIFHMPLDSLLKTITKDTDPNHNPVDDMYTFEYQAQIVWGASARILKQIESTLRFI